jgi:hypothetical protein
MILTVIFVVLMMFWLFSGYTATHATPPGWAAPANAFIPWLCVAILGWVVFNGPH